MSETIAITATTKATKSLTSAVKAVTDAIAAMNSVAELHEPMVEQVVEQQQAIDALAEQTEVAVRKAKVELDLKIQENEQAVLTELLEKNNLAKVTTTYVAELESDLVKAQADNTESLEAAIQAEANKGAIALNAAVDKATSAHKVETAELTAKIGTLVDKVVFLENQLAKTDDLISKEREARVEEAKARSQQAQPSITVTK